MINENLQDMNLWHVSKSKITSLGKTPMFFALEKEHSLGWYKSAFEDGAYKVYMYKATLKPDVNIVSYKELKQILAIHDDGYINMILSNPTSSEILNDEITKAAIKNGIDGIIYFDYDPRDFNNDLEAVLLFNPKQSISSFKSESPIDKPVEEKPPAEIVKMLKKVVNIYKKKYNDIDVNYDSGYFGKQAFRMEVDNFINGRELQVAYQYKNKILAVFIPGVLGTKELVVDDIENMAPSDIVNKINNMLDVKENLVRRVIRLEKLIKRLNIV
jgi:hypothetical protein